MSDSYQLVEKVVEQIKADIKSGDLSALEFILLQLPIDTLKGYLEEE